MHDESAGIGLMDVRSSLRPTFSNFFLPCRFSLGFTVPLSGYGILQGVAQGLSGHVYNTSPLVGPAVALEDTSFQANDIPSQTVSSSTYHRSNPECPPLLSRRLGSLRSEHLLQSLDAPNQSADNSLTPTRHHRNSHHPHLHSHLSSSPPFPLPLHLSPSHRQR